MPLPMAHIFLPYNCAVVRSESSNDRCGGAGRCAAIQNPVVTQCHGPVLNNILSKLESGFEPTIACSSIIAQLKATASGGGLCCLANFIADTEDSLECILAEKINFKREIWMVTHRDLVDLGRVQAVQRFIENQFAESKALFM